MIKIMRDASSQQLHALHTIAVEWGEVINLATRSLTVAEALAINKENFFGTGDSPTFESAVIKQHEYTLWSRRVKWLPITEEELSGL